MYRAPKRATQKKGGLRHEQVPPYRCVWIDYCYCFSFYFCWVWKRRENDSPEKVYGWLWTRIWRCFKVLNLNEKFSLNWNFINTNFKSAQVRRNLHPVEFDFNWELRQCKSFRKFDEERYVASPIKCLKAVISRPQEGYIAQCTWYTVELKPYIYIWLKRYIFKRKRLFAWSSTIHRFMVRYNDTPIYG